MSDDRYEVVEEVGRGAMGIVYKAFDRETSERVAIKVLKAEVLEDDLIQQRFKNELRIARKITHKNVCRIYEFTQYRRSPCISMEFVEGENLRSLMKRIGSFSLKSALDICRGICSGLQEAHAQGVVHRDLKPENLMIDRQGTVKIMDFGVARVLTGTLSTGTGMLIGTPAYMAPEQVEGREIDQRADIYSFGLIFYEMLTGKMTFEADTPLKVAYKHVHEPVTPPREIDSSIPVGIQDIILRCLEKEPERRFQTIDAVETALLAGGYVTAVRTASPAPPSVRTHNTTFVMPRGRARSLMLAIQLLYFGIYAAVLFHIEKIGENLDTLFKIPYSRGVMAVVICALCGIAARMYLSSALILGHPDVYPKYRQIFPALWALDSLWAAAPLLLVAGPEGRIGLALGGVAVLAYLPFSQKTLMENASMENPKVS